MPRVLDVLATAIAPDRCWHCRDPAPAGSLLCGVCRAGLPWIGPDGCRRCAQARPCPPGRCPARRAPFVAAWAPLAYEGAARTLALVGKERAATRVAGWFGAAMAARAPASVVHGAELVVAVPADPARRRRRGEDHATRIATVVGERLGLPVEPVLRRVEARQAQHLQARHGRMRLPAPQVVRAVPRPVLLVDDVHTTGATLAASARALRAAGCPRVTVLTALRAGR